MEQNLTVFVGGPFSTAMHVAENGIQFDSGVRDALEQVHQDILRCGLRLLSSHIADKYGTEFTESEIVPRDNRWVAECDIYLALLPLGPDGRPYRSDGTFVEIGLALGLKKKVVIAMQDRSHPEQSYYVRNLSCEPGVTIYDWHEFMAHPVHYINESSLRSTVRPAHECEREEATDPDQVLAILSLQRVPDPFLVRGIPLVVLPGVFSPRYSHAPDYMMRNWRISDGARVLDLGCGCGVLGVFALLDGAGSLTAVDCNDVALENTRLNLERHGLLPRSKVLKSDACDALGADEQFDLILLSPPYWNRPAANGLAAACFDEDYRFLSAAVHGAQRHLASDGRLLIIFSDQGDTSRLVRILQDSGFYLDRCVVHRPSMRGGHVRIYLEAKLLAR